VEQGDVYWIDLRIELGALAAGRRPYVVVQNDLTNRTGLATAIVCAVTTNMRRALFPGNVIMEAGEGGLKQRSVANVSQLVTVDRSMLVSKLGKLSDARVREIVRGVRLLIEPRR
jgi:mRNA interferase MazF